MLAALLLALSLSGQATGGNGVPTAAGGPNCKGVPGGTSTTGCGGVPAAAPACTLPSGTSDWQAATITGTTNCGTTGGTLCANNSPVFNVPDGIGSNAIGQTITTAQPLYLTSQINTLPAFSFDSVHTLDQLSLTSPIPTTNTTYSFFAAISPSSVTATNKLLGQTAATTGALRWYINSAGHQTVSADASAQISGTATLVANTWVVIGFTWNTATGALALYKCSGGTCTSDGTSTTVTTPTQTINAIGVSEGSSNFKGLMAEMWYFNGISNTGWGAWSQCKYGI